ncbi:MAG: glycosyltransferase family 4 protein [Bacteroidota bacterium]
MKIYHCVESYYPSLGGMQEVVKQLSERLVSLGHEVTVLTSFHPLRNFSELNGVRVETFQISGNAIEASTPEEKRYLNYLLNIDGDVVTFFAAQQWATNLALNHLEKIKAKKVSVPTGYSGLFRAEYREYFQRMKKWIHNYDMNVYLSNDYRDINFARENGISKTMLIPNGASADEFNNDPGIDIRKKFNIPQNHKILLHVGSYTGRKGHKEGIDVFLSSGLINCTLLMIGNDTDYFKRRTIFKFPILLMRWICSVFSSRKIILTEADRATTVSAYFQSDLFFFPSQVECSPIVLFEASAAGLPYLTTDVGNSIEIVKWTGAGEVMATQKDSNGFSYPIKTKAVKQLKLLLEDNRKLKEFSLAGRKNWKEKFTWEEIASQYLKMYKTLME